MNCVSSLTQILAFVVPVLAGCAPTDAQGGAPSLDLVATVDDAPMPIDTSLASRDELERALRASRALRIARLKTYAAAGRFALNDASEGLRFVWRDREGRLCAMADLVDDSGRGDLVDQVAREDNQLQLASVTSGALFDWMLHSGLTVEEIQLVQEPAFLSRGNDVTWEIARKRDHLRAVVERLESDTDRSIAIALARLVPTQA